MQYFADTPTGAWAEVLRHEEITDPEDLVGLSARIWAIRVADIEMHEPKLSRAALTSRPDGYETCREEARRLRATGVERIQTISAALKPGEGAGLRVGATGLVRAPARDGKVIVHFGRLPEAEGWCAAEGAHPDQQVLTQVRPLNSR